jgi:hypothetical protein
MTETTEPWPTYIVAVPALVIPHTDSVGPWRTICCPEGIARPVTAVTAVYDPTYTVAVPPLVKTRSRWYEVGAV